MATNGETHGHSAASGAYTVAATPAAATYGPPTPNGPYPGLFTSTSQTESFSSDGLRHNFFNADSSPITPGNFSSTGGTILNKPEITAADGVSVTGVGGFDNPFYGTSAAAPAAASVAALVLAAKSTITAAQMKTALTSTAIDIMNTGFDRDSGNGIVMAVPAIGSLGVTGSANPELGTVVATENPGNGNGTIERGEGALLSIPLQNTTGVMAATGITATLTSSTPGVTIMQPATSSYADLAVGAGAENNLTPFAFTLASNFPCAQVAQFTLTVSFSGGQTRTLNFDIQTGLISITNTLGSTPTVPTGITFGTGTQTGRLDRNGVVSSCSAPKAFPTSIAGNHSFDSYSFKSCSAQCFSPTLNAGAAGINLLEALYSPSFDSANIATNYAGDSGSSTNIQDFSVSLIGSTDYSIVVSDVAGNPPSGGPANTYTIQIPSCAVSCNVNQLPVAIAQDVTVTAATYNGTASASINNGSYDPDGGLVTLTQSPAGPYPIGTTSVILTVTDPLGAFAQATANVTVNQPLLTPATLAETFGAASIPLGGTTSLSFTLGNPNTVGSLSNVGFTDSLPSGLVITTPSGLSSTCGAGSFTAAAGSTSLSISGVTLAAGFSCSISVNVNAIAVGNQVNLTGATTSLEGGTGSKATASLLVTQATPTVTVSPVSIVYGTSSTTLTASIAYTGPSAPTGTVTFQVDSSATVNASCSGSASPLTCTATYTASSLSVSASHTITVSVVADTNYSTATNTGTLTVTQATPTITVSASSISYGTASTTLSASVAFSGAIPTGAFTFQVDSGAIVSAACTGAASPETCTATYTTSSLAVNAHTIKASLASDTNYNTASNTGTLTVTQATPAVTVSAASITYGTTSTTLSASLLFSGAAPVGAFTFQVDGGATVTASCLGTASPETCTATYTTSSLTISAHTIKASLASDTNYNAASNTGTLTVTPATPTIVVSSSSVSYGAASTTLSASVAFSGAVPTGAVTFQVDSESAVTGACTGSALSETCTATYATSALTVGPHVIKASLALDTNYNAASNTGTLTVTATTPTILVSPSSVSSGTASTTLSASVAFSGAAPTGAVTFQVDSGSTVTGSCTGTTPLETCTATYTTAALTVGPHIVKASLAPDASYNTVLNTGTLTVTPATPMVTASAASISYGMTSTILSAGVAFSGAAPTGAFTFQVDSGSTVTGACTGISSPETCTAIYATSALTAGPHIIKASLASDTNYNAASNTSTLSVTQATPTVIVSNASINYGASSTTLSASVAFVGAGPTGTFTFQVGSGATVIASCSGTASPEMCTASYTTSALTSGISYTITGSLGADTNYGKASGTGTLIVSKAPTTTALGALPQTVNPNQTVTLNAAVTSISPGTPSGTVSFYDNGALLQTITLINGSASYVTLLPAGATDAISAQYSGDTTFQSSQTLSVSTVIVLPLDFTLAPLSGMSSPFYIIPGNTATFSFQVTPLYGSFPGTVSFTINGLPNGVSYSFNPTSMAASSSGGMVTGTLTASPTLLVERKMRTNYAPMLASLLLLPLAGMRRFRRRRAVILMLLLGFAAVSFVTGCGSSGDGVLQQKQAIYPLTLTITSGNITHTVPFTLTVE